MQVATSTQHATQLPTLQAQDTASLSICFGGRTNTRKQPVRQRYARGSRTHIRKQPVTQRYACETRPLVKQVPKRMRKASVRSSKNSTAKNFSDEPDNKRWEATMLKQLKQFEQAQRQKGKANLCERRNAGQVTTFALSGNRGCPSSCACATETAEVAGLRPKA